MTSWVVAVEGWTPSNTIALVAIVVSTAGVVFAEWWASRIREEDRRDARRREAALVLGPVYSALSEAEFLRKDVVGHAEDIKRHEVLLDDWRKLKPAIIAMGLAYPDATVRKLVTGVVDDLGAGLMLGRASVNPTTRGPHGYVPTATNELRESRDERLSAARAELDELAAAIRGDAR
ncbi:MAG: hypothetical protein M3137_07580 [Actinomycetota bacterium]|nr:hypothetical protein [Actinomycetota bacterium]